MIHATQGNTELSCPEIGLHLSMKKWLKRKPKK